MGSARNPKHPHHTTHPQEAHCLPPHQRWQGNLHVAYENRGTVTGMGENLAGFATSAPAVGRSHGWDPSPAGCRMGGPPLGSPPQDEHAPEGVGAPLVGGQGPGICRQAPCISQHIYHICWGQCRVGMIWSGGSLRFARPQMIR